MSISQEQHRLPPDPATGSLEARRGHRADFLRTLQGTNPAKHFDLELSASRTMRQYIPASEAMLLVVLCWGTSNRLTDAVGIVSCGC